MKGRVEGWVWLGAGRSYKERMRTAAKHAIAAKHGEVRDL